MKQHYSDSTASFTKLSAATAPTNTNALVCRFFSLTLLAICFFTGCSAVHNVYDHIAGTSLQRLAQVRENSKTLIVNYGVEESFKRVVTILSEIDAEILKVNVEDFSILAVVSGGPMIEEGNIESMFDANSADVGVFFTNEGPEQTKVSINCLSTSILEFAVQSIFSKLQS